MSLLKFDPYKFVDSRNITLKENDLVFILNEGTYRHFGFSKVEILKDEEFKPYINLAHRFYNDYVFKIDSLLPFEQYMNRMNSPIYGYKLCKNDIDNYLNFMDNYNSMEVLENMEEKYKSLHNSNSLRGFSMVDFLGQDLKPGDFVVYRYTGKYNRFSFKYGVIISETKVFTEDRIIERVFYCCKLSNLTDEEKIIYKNLSVEYQKTLQTSKTVKQFRVGDVYISGKNSYIYLGKIDLVTNVVRQSNAISNVKFDKNKEYWLKFNNFIPLSLEDFDSKFDDRMKNSYVLEHRKKVVSNEFYYEYVTIEEFSCFVNSVSKNAIYHSNLNLPKKLIYQNSFESYISDFNYIFILN